MLVSILGLLSEGGIYLGERVILARLPTQLGNRTTWLASRGQSAAGITPGAMFVKHSFSDRDLNVSKLDFSLG